MLEIREVQVCSVSLNLQILLISKIVQQSISGNQRKKGNSNLTGVKRGKTWTFNSKNVFFLQNIPENIKNAGKQQQKAGIEY